MLEVGTQRPRPTDAPFSVRKFTLVNCFKRRNRPGCSGSLGALSGCEGHETDVSGTPPGVCVRQGPRTFGIFCAAASGACSGIQKLVRFNCSLVLTSAREMNFRLNSEMASLLEG